MIKIYQGHAIRKEAWPAITYHYIPQVQTIQVAS